ncbi:hypothetical protein C8R42DRAFT_644691 [Lentinula raphanica]|nr:hypothetical protein C8R42DRAFT_644691 [Lentinula raphanica]
MLSSVLRRRTNFDDSLGKTKCRDSRMLLRAWLGFRTAHPHTWTRWPLGSARPLESLNALVDIPILLSAHLRQDFYSQNPPLANPICSPFPNENGIHRSRFNIQRTTTSSKVWRQNSFEEKIVEKEAIERRCGRVQIVKRPRLGSQPELLNEFAGKLLVESRKDARANVELWNFEPSFSPLFIPIPRLKALQALYPSPINLTSILLAQYLMTTRLQSSIIPSSHKANPNSESFFVWWSIASTESAATSNLVWEPDTPTLREDTPGFYLSWVSWISFARRIALEIQTRRKNQVFRRKGSGEKGAGSAISNSTMDFNNMNLSGGHVWHYALLPRDPRNDPPPRTTQPQSLLSQWMAGACPGFRDLSIW